MTKPLTATKGSAEAAAEWIALDRLSGWERNPRSHGDGPRKIAASVIRYGWGAPVLARPSGELIAGHGRLLGAAMLAQMWRRLPAERRRDWSAESRRVAERGEVPVRWMDVGEQEAHELALADNRIAQESKWEKRELQALFGEWSDAGVDFSATGFDDEEVDRLLGVNDPVEVEALDVSELFAARFTITVSGPLPRSAHRDHGAEREAASDGGG